MPASLDHHRSTPPGGERRVVEMDIPSDVRFIEKVVERVRRECERMDFAQRQIMLNVPVALSEALSNAILRGNHEDPRKHVHVRAIIDPDELIVEVVDEGTGFDFDHSQIDPTTPENLEREDGRGLYLMRKLMDRVERLDAPIGNGSIVRMTLHRT